jgi:hypothetical protein
LFVSEFHRRGLEAIADKRANNISFSPALRPVPRFLNYEEKPFKRLPTNATRNTALKRGENEIASALMAGGLHLCLSLVASGSL